MGTVAAIYRHPVKSLGEEAVESVALEAGRHMPLDRVWAIAHGASKWDEAARQWVSRGNFLAQALVPELAQIRVGTGGDGRVALDHPRLAPLAVDPDDPADAARLTEWIAPLAAARRPGPYRLARLAEGALTDVPDAHVAINSTASLRAVEEAAGRPLAHIRFRGNLWVDGLGPWEEFELVGGEITVGTARLRVTERIGRCNATTANPRTGARDVPVPDILEGRWGHTDFGVYAQVIGGGEVRIGDPVRRA